MKTCRNGHVIAGRNALNRADGNPPVCRQCDLERRRAKDRAYVARYGTTSQLRSRYDALRHSVSLAVSALEAGNPAFALSVLRPRDWVRNEDFENLPF